MRRSSLVFIVSVVLWQTLVALMYGLFLRYNQTAFTQMSVVSGKYSFNPDGGTITSFDVNSTQFPFPQALLAVALILLIVGLALIAAYIERSAVSSMALTLLLLALTVQNFFLFRDFWHRAQANNPNANGNKFGGDQYYQQINYINFGNYFQSNSNFSYDYKSASWMEAIGATLGLYAAYSTVIGRIGFGEIFYLSLLGSFLYELNSQILWRLNITDNGFPSRAFGFGGTLGIVSSLILNQRELTKNNPNFLSDYQVRTLAFLGAILVWCTFPVLVTSEVLNQTSGEIVAMSAQVNIWLSLAGSAIGVFTASSFLYRKFCLHELVFASFSGAIAFSSSTDINYNPGAALTISSLVGFLCAIGQAKLKHKLNRQGVVDSNGAIFQFFIPSMFAAIFSAILAGVGQSTATFKNTTTTFTFAGTVGSGRSAATQGGYQIVGWVISVIFGAVAGVAVGLLYLLLDTREKKEEFYSDLIFYDTPKVDANPQGQPQEQAAPMETPQPNGKGRQPALQNPGFKAY